MQAQPTSTEHSPTPISNTQSTDLDGHLAAIADRDERAFSRWLSQAEHPIRASLQSFAGVVDTECVLQESLFRAWQVAPRVVEDGKPNALLRLAIRIAKNLAISEVRRTRSKPLDTDEMERRLNAASGGESPRPPDPMLRSVIARCRAELPPKPRQALDLRLSSLGGCSDATHAARAGMSKNTFLQNFTRARKQLAKHLAAAGVSVELELA